MSKINFKIGFWHPFGPHGLKENGEEESPEEIIERKTTEIDNNGWTLWSFQRGKEKTINQKINQWRKEIGKNKQIFVLCSDSRKINKKTGKHFYTTKNPSGKCFDAKQYIDENGNSQKIPKGPKGIKIPHPFGKNEFAYAFTVKHIHNPEMIKISKNIQWLKTTSGEWKSGPSPRLGGLPTRGEYLIKLGGRSKPRKIYSILELEYPYIVIIKSKKCLKHINNP